MKTKHLFIAIFSLSVLLLVSCSKGIYLASGKYVIVIPEKASAVEQQAASEFQRLIALSNPNAPKIEIVNDAAASKRKHEIVIGNVANRPLPNATQNLQRDGFTIQTSDNKLFIKGGLRKGTLYGVYSFFETYLGYRCYAPGVLKYPSLETIKIPDNLNDTQIPVNTFRNDFYLAVLKDQFYADWHKAQYNEPEWGLFVHTFNILVPPDVYFKEHPEYYSLIDGKRSTEQLCLSNPDVLKIVVENLAKRIKDNPEALYWSVSQNDNGQHCLCDKCAALDEAAQSPSGSIIPFVNEVAKQFPDKIISTLAYWYSRKAPVNKIHIEPNVNIMLCTIECLRHKPIENEDTSVNLNHGDKGPFADDLKAWGELSHNILLWDYVTNFAHFLTPFPNLRTLQPNIQFFVRNGVVAHFPEGNPCSVNGEFEKLRSYLLAKLLWNPDADVEAETKDFLTGYYEEATPFIEEYIKTTHDELEKSGLPLGIYQHPYDHFEKGFLRAELATKYEELFDKAEVAVASEPDVLLRVKIARLPITYAFFEIAKKLGAKDTRTFETVNGAIKVKPEILDKLQKFRDVCNSAEISYLHECWETPDAYYNATKRFLEEIK
ncbi:MAG: DUF4838 domain-containing protein [Dysgonamonadaceae bacterium]|jgi:hypothetical protein|nr:DUF4838 domain-containing protein [Dysgonamonadaceae bacterium]